MKNILLSLITLLLFSACSTLRVDVDYDENYDFSKITTFVIKHNTKAGENTLVNDRITDAIKTVLQAKGYSESAKNPEMIIVYHYSAKEKIDINTDYQMVGISRYGFGGTMIATTSTYNYTEGTVVIDAYDPKSKKIVWRGIGVLELEPQETPQEKREYTKKVIETILQKFPAHRELL